MNGAAVLPSDFSRRVSELLFAPGGTLDAETTSQFEASGSAAGVTSRRPFVVDAHSIVLRPGARERVRLRLCATTCGTLRITGARWRLFGEVGGMHQLVRPGPLLHASREQRATRARAPDLSLTFHVVGDLPWLQASLLGMPATMLQGEVVPASLLLVNRGRAPAGDILLRSSLAWLVVGSASAILPVGHSASVPTEAAPPEAQPLPPQERHLYT